MKLTYSYFLELPQKVYEERTEALVAIIARAFVAGKATRNHILCSLPTEEHLPILFPDTANARVFAEELKKNTLASFSPECRVHKDLKRRDSVEEILKQQRNYSHQVICTYREALDYYLGRNGFCIEPTRTLDCVVTYEGKKKRDIRLLHAQQNGGNIICQSTS